MIRATLIYNPTAGSNPAKRKDQIRRAAEALRESGFTLAIEPTPGPGSAASLAQAAVRSGTDLLIVCGGDGTINEVINGIAQGGTPLAILPGGTANIAAKELGLPSDPVAAARELPRWRPRRIALGCVAWGESGVNSGGGPAVPSAAPGVRYFLSVAGVGYDAHVVESLNHDLKDSFGVIAYGWEAIRQLRRYTFPVVVCRSEDGEWHGTLALFQRTERYAGWLHLAPGATFFNDRLRLCLFESSRPSRYFVYAAAVLLRRHRALKDVRSLDCNSVVCAAEDPRARIFVELDGELAGELPARFEIVPDGLTLLAPPE